MSDSRVLRSVALTVGKGPEVMMDGPPAVINVYVICFSCRYWQVVITDFGPSAIVFITDVVTVVVVLT